MQNAIIGFGELGKQIYGFINNSNEAEFVFFDDNTKAGIDENSFAFSEFTKSQFKDAFFYVSLGYRFLENKHKILNELFALGRETPRFIHDSSYLEKSCEISRGCLVYPMCNLDKNVKLGVGTLLNNSVVVSHDTTIGDCCYISPGVIFSGNVNVGDYTFIGSGTVISNNITIGKNVKVGAGTIVTRDIPDDTSVIGNPMRVLQKELQIK
jgi:sugar O-acyltransferase (sialic acid O-acetyltransferase NeuD family)